MSHVPCDLAGGTPDPVGACCAIVKVEPTRVSTSGSKFATSILIFIVILSALRDWLRRSNKTESHLGFGRRIPSNILSGLRIPPDSDLAPPCTAVSCDAFH